MTVDEQYQIAIHIMYAKLGQLRRRGWSRYYLQEARINIWDGITEAFIKGRDPRPTVFWSAKQIIRKRITIPDMEVPDRITPFSEACEHEFLDSVLRLPEPLQTHLWFRHLNPTDHRWVTESTDDLDLADSILMDRWGLGPSIVRNGRIPRFPAVKPDRFEEPIPPDPQNSPSEPPFCAATRRPRAKMDFRVARCVRWLWDGPKVLSVYTQQYRSSLKWLDRHGVIDRIVQRGRMEYKLRAGVRGDNYQCKSIPFEQTVAEMLDSGEMTEFFDGKRAWDSVRDEERNIVCVRESGAHFAGSVARAEVVFLMTPRIDGTLVEEKPMKIGPDKAVRYWERKLYSLRLACGTDIAIRPVSLCSSRNSHDSAIGHTLDIGRS